MSSPDAFLFFRCKYYFFNLFLTFFRMFPVHLILISIIPLLIIVLSPDAFLFYNISITLFVTLLGVAIILQIIISFFTKNKLKSALVVSWLYIVFFSYGHAHYLLNQIMGSPIQEVAVRNWFLVPVWLGVTVFGSIWILKTKKTLEGLTRFVNVWSITMVSLSLLSIAFYSLKEDKLAGLNFFSGPKVKHADVGGSKKLPDIYFIITDAYANEHTLRETYDYDNSSFLKSLKKRGFYVASESRSNYPSTVPSLSSLLNMDYIDQKFFETAIQLGKMNITQDSQLQQYIEDNKVTRVLKDLGYKIIHIATGRRLGKENPSADIAIKCDQISEVVSVLIRTSLYFPFEKKFQLMGNSRRQQALCLFDNLGEIANAPGPKFIFGHVMVPHPSYIFGPNGESLAHETSKKRYVGQLIFTSKKIVTMVDKILGQSDSQPIIIIQSDHGPEFPYIKPNPMKPWEGVYEDDQFKRDRLKNLSAFFLPGKENEMVYPTISNVNTFRLIFNLYFNMDYKLLEDKSYFSWWPANSYRMEEINPYARQNLEKPKTLVVN